MSVTGVACAERVVTTGDGVDLAVRDYWSGGAVERNVALLHGFCQGQSCWDVQIGHLERRWGNTIRVISYDHRGHGRSDPAPVRTYRIDRLARDLAEVLGALEVEGPLTIAGHSMGGMAALAFCSGAGGQLPVEPDSMVLIATAAGRLAERGLGRLLGTPALGALAELVARVGPAGLDDAVRAVVRPLCAALTRCGRYSRAERDTLAAIAADAVKATPLTTAVGFLPGLRAYDQSATLGAITAKTTVISGGADVITPAAHARELTAGIPGAIHVHVPTGGHMLLHDAPHVVTSVINRAISHRREPVAAGVPGSVYAC